MKAVVDISTVLTAWQKELDFHRQKVKEYELKVAALTEAASMSASGSESSKQDLLGKGELSLPKSVIKILRTKGEWLSTQELNDELQKAGFRSNSKNFILLLSNTLQKMSTKGKIQKRKEEGGGRSVKFAMPGTLFKD